MNCRGCRDMLVAYMEASLDGAQAREVSSHMEACAWCATEYRELLQLQGRIEADALRISQRDYAATVMARVIASGARPRKENIRMFELWKRIGLPAAACLVIAVTVVAVILDRSSKVAYAIEQSVEAFHSVQYMHVKQERPGFDVPDKDREMWAQFDQAGKVERVRIHFPMIAGEGSKTVLWADGKGTVYFEAKKILVTVPEADIQSKLPEELLEVNLDMERLKKAQDDGRARVEITEPSSAGEMIRVKVTYTGNGFVDEYRVDPVTKLVQDKTEFAAVKDGKLELVSRTQFLEYNKPFTDEIWKLDVAADAAKIDQTAIEIGLAKGTMTEEEVAAEVVKQFFEALIAKDYKKAGLLYEGMPAERVKASSFGDIEFVRIVSIGKPFTEAQFGGGALVIKCQIEVKVNGVTSTREFSPGVRMVYNQKERRGIFGFDGI